MRLRLALIAAFLSACSVPTTMTVFATSDAAPAIQSFFEFLPEAHATVSTSTNPAGDASSGKGSGVRIALVSDLNCGDCFKLTGGSWNYTVHAGGTAGLQYGLAQLLESMNFRFFHPWAVKAPAKFASPDKSDGFGETQTPQMTLRGLHLHTLHPIEGYFSYWVPGAQNLQDARRITDWTIKNRGNYVEWCALNNIVPPGPDQVAWQAHAQAIIADAHQRGIKVGLGVELFGVGNLQQAFDFLDTEDEADPQAMVDSRLSIILTGLPWDVIDLSFGEFAGTDPTVFLNSVNVVYQELQKLAPGTTLAATIHMDNSPSLQITYDGTTLPYYFLVQYANPAIVPWIHSVMYFDLFEPADGAYLYSNFDEHLGYLQGREQAGNPVAYYPESAYWIAFDDSVPTYMPVYMHSRWLDMHNLSAASTAGGYAQLTQHVQFSSGFEWNYWQNDYATLRMNWNLPASWDDELQEMYSPWGAQGQQLAAQLSALGVLQDNALIQQALSPYVASRDSILDVGGSMGEVSQPPREEFSDVAAMTPTKLATFQSTILTPLDNLITQTAQIQSAIAALKLDASDPWLSESLDGVNVDVARTQFIDALYHSVVSFTMSGTDGGWLAKADTALATGTAIVGHRDSHLHYPVPSLLTGLNPNDTLYQYGYLYEADTMCYWNRERIQARAIVVGDVSEVPACILQ